MLLVEYKDKKTTQKQILLYFSRIDKTKNRESVKVTNFNKTKKEESYRTIPAINT